MVLPSSRLKIVGRTYGLRLFRKSEQGECMDRWGECMRDDAQIRLHPELESRIELCANTLLHEIMHAIHYEMAINTPNEEQVVTQFTNGLIGVFKNNPKVILFIAKSVGALK